MKRKLLSVLLIISLVFLLFSCDGSIVDIMKKMGNNVAGVDNEAVTSAVESVAVNNSITVEDKDKVNSLTINSTTNSNVEAYKFTYGEGTELFTVGKITNGNNIIAINGTGIQLGSTDVDLSKVTSVLPPQSLDTILSTLDGNGKDELLKELKKEITDETTKDAAQGTKKVLLALLEADDDVKSDTTVKTIIQNMQKSNESDNGDAEKKLTVGDLVVLQTITNVIADVKSAVFELFTDDNSSDENEDDKDFVDNLLDIFSEETVGNVYDYLINTTFILNSVSETTTILDGFVLNIV